ncbi:Mitochondrial presequence protease [Myotisia sp. PD_48]|nr:Mitochondrial presequence protease [Myotisia sp. PD_48]
MMLSKLGGLRAARQAGLKQRSSPSLFIGRRRWASTVKDLKSKDLDVTDLRRFPEVGEELHGFTVQQKKHVPELHLTAIHLKHNGTNADYLHVARDDKNNVFSIGFKTNPPDATGVPHILEHTTLCGSEKYPVRDPFFKMLPRSLSNFMNAFTSSDHTSYPFATTNVKDFQNLFSVYMDATLHPLLKEEDFRQEGWRLGPENAEKLKSSSSQELSPSDIVFKGVVYNEMKGQTSDANYLYYIKFKEHIFPAINNSGGDPQFITDLTHQQLVAFSKANYHPSNAKLFSYGNMRLPGHLYRINSVFQNFQNNSRKLDVKLPKDLSSGPLSITIPGPVDTFASDDKQYKTSVSWLAGDSTNTVEIFSMGILSSLLLDGYGSPIYKALIESGIGSSFTPNTGLDTSGKVPIFSIGVNGIGENDVAKVRTQIQKAYQDHLSNGFEDEKVQGLLHQLELGLRHKTANFGLGIMEKVMSGWFNGSDPMKDLAWNEIVTEFKRLYEQPGYLEGLLQKYFMNDNCLNFTMVGSPSYNQELLDNELSRKTAKLEELSAKHGSMDSAINHLKNQELELLEIQEAARDSDISCLPTLHTSEIARQKDKKPVSESKINNVDVVWREAPTNGLTYIQIMNIFNELPSHLRLLLPLFNDCIMRLGTAGRTMEKWEDLIKLRTGGITTSTFAVSSPVSLNKFSEGLQYSGYALNENIPNMLEILTTLVNETDFTGSGAAKMIEELLISSTNGALDAVAGSGHRFAVNAASSILARKYLVQEQQSGLSQIQTTALLLRDAQSSPDKLQELIRQLQLVQSFAIAKSANLRVRVVCEAENRSNNEASLTRWLDKLSSNTNPERTETDAELPYSSHKVLYDLPFQVSYTGSALQTAPFVDPSSAPLSVLAQLLTHKYLHPEIREKGGAYGASASNGPVQGLFTLSSYRDPNPMNTLKVFNNSGIFARDKAWTERELNEAKLGIFQSLDAPVSVDEEGHRYFMSGVTEEMDQRWREQVLDVNAQDVKEAAQEFLVNGPQRSVCLLGEKKQWPDLLDWETKKLSMSPSEPQASAPPTTESAAGSA